ncbi:GNAT family N-acetyltransferase [Nocardia sp. NPDC057272]|uniref:GNAT family N-acetyltransferase n=1 Tax=Nocardia sp. NPDC057272 TaxID=3346079 RepID=UPI00362B8856
MFGRPSPSSRFASGFANGARPGPAATVNGLSPSNGEVAGRIGFRQSDLTEVVTELAYWTLPARRGHSIAPGAANMLTRWAFHDVGFDRIELTHSVHNLPSCRVAAKCGFPFEGTLRGAGRHSDGRHDMHLYARLRTD